MIVQLADRHATRRALDGIDLARRFRMQAEACETEWLAALASDPDPYRDGIGVMDKDWIVEDVACTLQVSSSTAAARLHIARQLATRFPATFNALIEHRLELRHATRFVEAAEALPDAVLPALEAKVLEHGPTQTITQFAARVRRLVAELDPRTDEEQHQVQRDLRRVVFTPVGHGMTELWALLPADTAAALQSVIQQHAESTRANNSTGDDDRTADQRRADALGELATGGSGLHPIVHVTMPLSMLLGLDDLPAELAGHGPIPAAIGRALAFDPTGTWRRLLTDEAGTLHDVTSQTYRPPAPMQRFVELRDRTCRFPTCRRRSENCEIDHVRPWLSGGPTNPANLIPLCSRHHHLKHDGRRRVKREPDGTISWASPSGRRWTTPPPEPIGGRADLNQRRRTIVPARAGVRVR